MVLTEFDEEKFLKMMRAEERAEGRAEGLEEGHRTGLAEGHRTGLAEGHKAGLAAGRMESLLGILSELGEVPPEIMVRAKELDADDLKRWTKLAVKAASMEEFLEQIR